MRHVEREQPEMQTDECRADTDQSSDRHTRESHRNTPLPIIEHIRSRDTHTYMCDSVCVCEMCVYVKCVCVSDRECEREREGGRA